MKLDLRDIQRVCPELAPLLEQSAPSDETVDHVGGPIATHQPEMIGPHLVLGELGKGGMGVVYRVGFNGDRHHECALKTLQSLTPTAAQRHRHDIERFVQTAVKHLDGFVQILAIGEDQGRPYFVMEYFAGGTLRDRLRDGGLEPNEAAALIRQLARSVHLLHEAGFLHRDLKPANVLYNQQRQPLLTDFGLARQIEQDGPTEAGEIMGTPEYMAPEQASGEAVDRRADIWSLGVMLYELLAGQTPFRRATPERTRAHVASKPPFENLLRDHPAALQQICIKCLQGDQAERYATAQELADDLDCYLRAGTIPHRVPATWWVHNWLRLNPWVWKVVLLLTLGVGVSFAWLIRSNLAERDKADAELHKRSELEAKQQLINYEKERYQRELFARQLQEVHALCHTEPDHARALLLDERRCPLALRDFTWHWLHESCLRARWSYALPDGPYSNVCFSADGNWLAAVDRHGNAGLWRVDRAERRLTDSGTLGAARCLCFHPDGKSLALGTVNGELRLVDRTTREARQIGQHASKRALHIIRFSPDGERVAAGADNGSIYLWDARGRLVRELEGPRGRAFALAFSTDGQTLAAGAGSDAQAPGTVCWWDLSRFEPHTLERKLRANGLLLEFQPHKPALLAFSTLDGEVVGYDLTARQEQYRYQGSVRGVTCLHYDTAGERLLLGGRDDTNSRDGTLAGSIGLITLPGLLQPLQGFRRGIQSLTLVDHTLYAADEAALVAVVDLRPTLETQRLTGHTDRVTAVTVSADGRWLLSGSNDHSARLEAITEEGTRLTRTLPLDDDVNQVALSSDGTTLITATVAGTVQVWPREGMARHTFKHTAALSGMALHPEEPLLLTGTVDGMLTLWDIQSGQKRTEVKSALPLRCLTLSRDGKQLVVADWNRAKKEGGIQHWRLDSKGLNFTSRWPVPQAEFLCLAFDTTGTLLAGGDLGGVADNPPTPGQIHVWTTSSEISRATLTVARGSVNALAFAPDGQTLVSASSWDSRNRGQLTFWDTFTWEERLGVPAHAEAITALAFGGLRKSILISASNDQSVALWRASVPARRPRP